MTKDRGQRDYCFTDYSLDEDFLQKLDYKYLCYGKEICPTTGRPHLQAYIYFKNAKTFSAVKKILPTQNFRSCNGTTEDNVKYCSKEGIFKEFGERPSQGARNDIRQIIDKIQTGSYNMRDVVAEATSYQSVRMAEVRLKYFEPPRNWKPEIHWYYGSSGTGKTRDAYNECTDPYVCLEDIKWWEGYDAHEEVIIDDYRRDFCKFKALIKLLDCYEFRVECKGGSRQLRAKKIIITTPKSPVDTWEGRTEEDLYQLTRRIDIIRYYRTDDDGNSGYCEGIDFNNRPIPKLLSYPTL
ncbi:MAG: helicase [Violenivirus cotis]|uniref:Helicase n=1 Tax=Circoviridae sp. TaxID=1954248 RepID=A0A345MXC4_9VIRU|nr:MAG: helicase [Circoviridae sp.]